MQAGSVTQSIMPRRAPFAARESTREQMRHCSNAPGHGQPERQHRVGVDEATCRNIWGDLASLYGMPLTQALNCLNQKEIEPPHKAQCIERHRVAISPPSALSHNVESVALTTTNQEASGCLQESWHDLNQLSHLHGRGASVRTHTFPTLIRPPL